MKSFHEMSTRAQVLVFVLLCGLTVAAAWQVLIGPAQAQLTLRRERLSVVRTEVSRALATAQKLPAIRTEIAALEHSLQATTAILPDEKDAQEVLRGLHVLASEAALAISSFTPKPVTARAQYTEWPIALGFEGGYHDLGRFFDSVAEASRLVSISDLHIKAVPASPAGRGPRTDSTITASCVATTFVFRAEDAAAAAAAAAAGTTPGRQP